MVAEVLGMNPGQIDFDEDLAGLCTDAVHQVRLAGAIKDLLHDPAAQHAPWTNWSLRELMAEISRSLSGELSGGRADTGEYTLRLEDVAYTLQAGREAFDERVAIVVRNLSELEGLLSRFADGEHNLPDVYTASLDPQRDIAAILFQNGPGHEFIRSAITHRQLPQLAQLWLLKAKIDWKLLHDEPSCARVIPLPNYIFDKQRYWIGNSFSAAQAAGPSEASRFVIEPPQISGDPRRMKRSRPVSPVVPAEAEQPSASSAYEVKQCLEQTLEEVIYREAGTINPDLPFSELGVNSVLTLELVDKLNDRLGLSLHSNDLFNYNTLRLLTAHILNMPGHTAVLSGDAEPAADDPVDLNELELLLEGR